MNPGASVPVIEDLQAQAYRFPTPCPESDGTLTWEATTMVLARVRGGDVEGLGWTYADPGCVPVITGPMAEVIVGRPLLDVPARWLAMQQRFRNLGRPGLASCALSAVDIALWDAAAQHLDVPVSRLLGRCRDEVPVYGSGGFTSLSEDELVDQLRNWVTRQQLPRVKIKIGEGWGSRIDRDLDRIRLARHTVGAGVELFVDANGGYTLGQARRMSRALDEFGVTWFEEPVSSDDLAGLDGLRGWCTADVAAGEYGYDLSYFARMAPVVDCVQVDVTRCGGFTEWRRIAGLAAGLGREVSAHCAPNLSVHAGAATLNFRHIEWFVDHDRIETEVFDGCADPRGGTASPSDRAGHGLTVRDETALAERAVR
jgi:L-alanine-DL-glutamate epimerase-like enolase superfamily enzyme